METKECKWTGSALEWSDKAQQFLCVARDDEAEPRCSQPPFLVLENDQCYAEPVEAEPTQPEDACPHQPFSDLHYDAALQRHRCYAQPRAAKLGCPDGYALEPDNRCVFEPRESSCHETKRYLGIGWAGYPECRKRGWIRGSGTLGAAPSFTEEEQEDSYRELMRRLPRRVRDELTGGEKHFLYRWMGPECSRLSVEDGGEWPRLCQARSRFLAEHLFGPLLPRPFLTSSDIWEEDKQQSSRGEWHRLSGSIPGVVVKSRLVGEKDAELVNEYLWVRADGSLGPR